jgi:NAD(P)-dependent dehydrogenase (short-subunit alcohol dehydrogenase family)
MPARPTTPVALVTGAPRGIGAATARLAAARGFAVAVIICVTRRRRAQSSARSSAREALLRSSTRQGGSGGAIVNVSSGAPRLDSPNELVDYAATRGALDTLTLGLAREVADGTRACA